MKLFQIIILSGLSSLMLTACKKSINTNLEVQSTTGMANLKIIHASPYTINYSAQLKVNDVRVSNNITNATPFPGGGLNTQGASSPWYIALMPGTTKISLSVPKAGTNVDSIPLYTGTINIDADKFYSAYLTDTAANTQMLLFTENVAEVENGFSRYKFINLIPNAAALDLYFGTAKVASNVAYKSASPEFTLDKNTTAAQWSIRTAGAAPTSTAITIYPTGTTTQTIPNKRILSVFARGYIGGTGNKVPAVSLLYN